MLTPDASYLSMTNYNIGEIQKSIGEIKGMTMTKNNIKTLGELKATNYRSRSVKDELRENLIAQLQKHEGGFEGIVGYEGTVIPDLQTAILSRHNILLLGLRGQAKTRIARLMVNLL